MAVNGKRKGNTFEREVSKILTEYLDIQFRPTPGSGAYVGGQNRGSFLREDVNEILAGDLIAGSSDFPFCIECKWYKDDPKFHHILQGSCQILDEWLAQVVSDAEHINKNPMVIFKVNRKGTYVVIGPEVLKQDEGHRRYLPHLIYRGWVIVSIDNFFKHGLDWNLVQ